MIKQIMIPVAAFAVTVTGASAFNSAMLEKIDIDLSDSQVSALEEAHEMRIDGADRDEVRDYLEESGIDQDTMGEIREAVHEARDISREAVQSALDDDDYDAFIIAIAGTPMADAIDSEADFETFKEAHELRQSGDHEGAAALMSELGIEKPEGHGGPGGQGGEMRGGGENGPRGDGEGRGEGRGGSRGGQFNS